MLSTNLGSEEKLKRIDEENVYNCKSSGISLVKSAAIYGANASGKSNIIKAMRFMRDFVINSSRTGQNLDIIPVEPFLLDVESTSNPSGFEVIILIDGTRYRYGFELDSEKIHSEWLYYVPKNREFKLFIREGDKFDISEKFKREAKDLQELTRPNALFLSVIAQFNGIISGGVTKWFSQIMFIDYRHQPSFSQPLRPILRSDENRKAFAEFLQVFDVGISDLKVEETNVFDRPELSSVPNNIRDVVVKNNLLTAHTIKTVHDVYDSNGNLVSNIEFDLDTHESDGTKKLYSILPSLMTALVRGGVVVIDELDSRLHPLLTEKLINLFHTGSVNEIAQLIFTTHDTNLLRKENFRRDQIWFVEKTQKGVSTLYSLAEIQTRNDANYEKDYLKGRYGAIPFLNTSIIEEHLGVKSV